MGLGPLIFVRSLAVSCFRKIQVPKVVSCGVPPFSSYEKKINWCRQCEAYKLDLGFQVVLQSTAPLFDFSPYLKALPSNLRVRQATGRKYESFVPHLLEI